MIEIDSKVKIVDPRHDDCNKVGDVRLIEYRRAGYYLLIRLEESTEGHEIYVSAWERQVEVVINSVVAEPKQEIVKHATHCNQFRCDCGLMTTFAPNSCSFKILLDMKIEGLYTVGRCPECGKKHVRPGRRWVS